MFPIARALIGRERHGGRFVYPTMRQIKFGTFLRGEPDKRTYGAVLRGRSAEEWRCWFVARRQRSTSEHEFDGSPLAMTVLYAGLGRYFHDLEGHSGLIADWLFENSRDKTPAEPFDIGIHVRLGDFVTGDPNAPGNSIRQPFEWYRAAFEAARHMLGVRAPSVVLFTDSDPCTVVRDLAIANLTIDRSANALSAILRLSLARVLIPSRSTFSMWAAFLGGMPVIWDRRYDARTRALSHRPELDHVV
jgi:hypothetical protein